MPTSRAAGATVVDVEAALEDWHPIAPDWYLSLEKSGQSVFYEPSDWASARFLAEAMSRNLGQGQRMLSQMFSATLSGMTDAPTTRADGRIPRVSERMTT